MSDRALRPVLRERRDIGLGFMLALLGFIGACLVLMLAIAYFLFPRQVQDRRFALPVPRFPAPVLQPSPPVDMHVFYEQEMDWLNTAGWIDRKAGIVHVPIDQAMRALATEGIKGWPTGSTTASEGDRR